MKWMGKCPECGEWNTLEEQMVQPAPKTRTHMPVGDGTLAQPVALSAITNDGAERLPLQHDRN